MQAVNTTDATIFAQNNLTMTRRPPLLDVHKFEIAYAKAHFYLVMILFAFGIIFNTMSIVVLTRKHMRSPINFILTSLAIADMIVLGSRALFIIYTRLYLDNNYCQSPYRSKSWRIFVVFLSNVYTTSVPIAMWLNVSLAIFRYIFVCMHQKTAKMCTVKRAKMTVAVVCLAAIIVSLPSYLQRDVVKFKKRSKLTNSTLECGYLIIDSHIEMSSPVVFEILTKIKNSLPRLLPCVLMIVISIRLIIAIMQAKRRRISLASNTSRSSTNSGHYSRKHNRTTTMLVIIVLCFGVTAFPYSIIMTIGVVNTAFFDLYLRPLNSFTLLLVLINSVINFIIYCTMSKKFRDTMKSLFTSSKIFSVFHCFKKYDIRVVQSQRHAVTASTEM